MDRDSLALLISLAALLVSGGGAIAAYVIGARQNSLQERLLNLETNRERDRSRELSTASVRAQIDKSGRNARLRLTNSGAEARSIVTRIDGKPVLSHDLIPEGSAEIKHLGSGASSDYLLAIDMQSPPKIFVEIEWQDPSRRPGQWSTELSL